MYVMGWLCSALLSDSARDMKKQWRCQLKLLQVRRCKAPGPGIQVPNSDVDLFISTVDGMWRKRTEYDWENRDEVGGSGKEGRVSCEYNFNRFRSNTMLDRRYTDGYMFDSPMYCEYIQDVKVWMNDERTICVYDVVVVAVCSSKGIGLGWWWWWFKGWNVGKKDVEWVSVWSVEVVRERERERNG